MSYLSPPVIAFQKVALTGYRVTGRHPRAILAPGLPQCNFSVELAHLLDFIAIDYWKNQ